MSRIKGIILCEGETDQVLISSYLRAVRGWQYCNIKNSPFRKEPIRWFKKGNDEPKGNDDLLGFWPVEGNSFAGPVETILSRAELGVALAVFSPDKVFTTMQELIDSVDWSEFEATDKQFKLLTEI